MREHLFSAGTLASRRHRLPRLPQHVPHALERLPLPLPRPLPHLVRVQISVLEAQERVECRDLIGFLLERVDDLLEVLGEDVALGDVAAGVENLVLLGELDEDAI